MSILIEGMEMPKAEFGSMIVAIRPDGMVEDVMGCYVGKAVPVPEPHGDLIDREKLQHIIGQFNLNWEYGQGVSDCWDALLNAPTVIPAEECE